MGFSRWGIFLSSMVASPPSTFFSCAFSAAVVAKIADAERKLRRALSTCSVVTDLALEVVIISGSASISGIRLVYLIAPFLHFPKQFIQTTQRL